MESRAFDQAGTRSASVRNAPMSFASRSASVAAKFTNSAGCSRHLSAATFGTVLASTADRTLKTNVHSAQTFAVVSPRTIRAKPSS